MISRSVISSLLLFTALFANPARAQDSQTVTNFDEAMITRLLQDVQAEFVAEDAPNGRKAYRAASGQLRFTLRADGCRNQTTCRGLLIISVFTRNDSRSLAELDNFLSLYNDRTPKAKVYRVPNGSVVIQAYIDATGGISYYNLRAQLLSFGQQTQNLRRELTEFGQQR